MLSITPLAITNIIKEEENASSTSDQRTEATGKHRQALVSSLQQLHDYEGLLTPPLPAIPLANQAALKAMMFLSGISEGSEYFDGLRLNDMPVNCGESSRFQERLVFCQPCVTRCLVSIVYSFQFELVLEFASYLFPQPHPCGW